MIELRLVTTKERWNLFTWFVLLVLLVAYLLLIGLLAWPIGLTQDWLFLLGLGPEAFREAIEFDFSEAYPRGRTPRASPGVGGIMHSALIIPLLVAAVPSLSTLLLLMKLVEKRGKRKRRRGR